MEKTLTIIAFLSFIFLIQPLLPVSYIISSIPWKILFHWMFHASFSHLAYNMISFFMFGSLAERDLGNLYIPFLALSALFSGYVASLFYPSFLGFSGVVYSLIGYVSARKPTLMVPAFGLPMPLVVASLMWILQDTAGLLLDTGGIAYASHLAGFAFGLFVGIVKSIHVKPSSGEMEGSEVAVLGEYREEF